MSQQVTTTNPNTPKKNKSSKFLRIFLIALGIASLIILPMSLYLLGTLIALHLAYSDVNTFYSWSAFYQLAQNVTHVSTYGQMSTLNQGMAINLGNDDATVIPLVLMLFGLVADFPLAHYMYHYLDREEEED